MALLSRTLFREMVENGYASCGATQLAARLSLARQFGDYVLAADVATAMNAGPSTIEWILLTLGPIIALAMASHGKWWGKR